MSNTVLHRNQPAPGRRLVVDARSIVSGATSVPTWAALLAIGLVAAVARGVLAVAHTTPRFFPDEYIYSSLARSLAHGSLTIRGQSAHFPALLEPLLAAPTWWSGNVEVAYRLTQMLNVGAMSLAAVPVYLLARRSGLTRNAGLACAALAVASPAMLFSSYIMAEPIAYPLVLAAVAAAVAALDRPTRGNQVALLAFAGLAGFARVQFVVLVPAFLVAAVVVEGFHLRRLLRAYRLVFGVVATLAVAVALAGLGASLGYYRAVLHLRVDPIRITHWVGVDLMLLAYASGLALVPCALLGLASGFRRSAPRAHRAFAAMTVTVAAALLGQAALYASNGSERFMERYLFYLIPLVPIAFFLGLRHLPAGRWFVVAAALGLLLLTMRVPVTGYTVMTGRQDSPFLSGVFRLESAIGFGNGSLAIAAVAGLLCLMAIGVGARTFGAAAAVAVALTFASFVAVGGASASQDALAGESTRSTYLSADADWVDRSKLGPVALLSTPGSARVGAQLQLFWNRSLSRVILMKGADPIDVFGHETAAVRADGRLTAAGKSVRQPVLIEELGSRAALEGARLVRRTTVGSLWKPSRELRLGWLARGLNYDGWWDLTSRVTVWPRGDGPRVGTLELPFLLPPGYEPMSFRLIGPGVARTITVRSGKTTVVRIPVNASKPVSFKLETRRPTEIPDGRIVVAHGGTPRFITGTRRATGG